MFSKTHSLRARLTDKINQTVLIFSKTHSLRARLTDKVNQTVLMFSKTLSLVKNFKLELTH